MVHELCEVWLEKPWRIRLEEQPVEVRLGQPLKVWLKQPLEVWLKQPLGMWLEQPLGTWMEHRPEARLERQATPLWAPHSPSHGEPWPALRSGQQGDLGPHLPSVVVVVRPGVVPEFCEAPLRPRWHAQIQSVVGQTVGCVSSAIVRLPEWVACGSRPGIP